MDVIYIGISRRDAHRSGGVLLCRLEVRLWMGHGCLAQVNVCEAMLPRTTAASIAVACLQDLPGRRTLTFERVPPAQGLRNSTCVNLAIAGTGFLSCQSLLPSASNSEVDDIRAAQPVKRAPCWFS